MNFIKKQKMKKANNKIKNYNNFVCSQGSFERETSNCVKKHTDFEIIKIIKEDSIIYVFYSYTNKIL